MRNSFSNEKITQSLASYEKLEDRLNKVTQLTSNLAEEPLERLFKSLGRISDKAIDTSDILNTFAEDLLKSVTESLIKGAMGSGTKDTQSPHSDIADLSRAWLSFAGSSGFAASRADMATPVNVTVLNNSSANASVNERVNANGQREIEIMIDNMVANSLSQGAQTRSVLRSLFGIDNLLRSR